VGLGRFARLRMAAAAVLRATQKTAVDQKLLPELVRLRLKQPSAYKCLKADLRAGLNARFNAATLSVKTVVKKEIRNRLIMATDETPLEQFQHRAMRQLGLLHEDDEVNDETLSKERPTTVVDKFYLPAAGGQPRARIVFLHGTFGNYLKTWSHDKSGLFWPGELHRLEQHVHSSIVGDLGTDDDLVALFKRCDVFSVMHGGSHATEPIEQIAAEIADGLATNDNFSMRLKTPIILVCHSLGGLIAKELLCRKGFLAANPVRGVIFFGSPHLGSSVARGLKEVLPDHMAIHQMSDRVYLASLQARFLQAVAAHRPGLKILSFHETRKMYNTPFFVTTPESARSVFGTEKEDRSIACQKKDHIEVCKFDLAHPDDSERSTFSHFLYVVHRWLS